MINQSSFPISIRIRYESYSKSNCTGLLLIDWLLLIQIDKTINCYIYVQFYSKLKTNESINLKIIFVGKYENLI